MILYPRFKRRRFPQLERLGRLDIIMAIDQEMRASGFSRASWGLRDDDRVALGRTEPRIQSDALAVIQHPFGACLQIAFMLRLSRHTRETDILAKFAHEPRLVVFQVIEDS